MSEKEILKREYKKQKCKVVSVWKALTIFLLIVSIIIVPVSMLLSLFDNTVAAFVGGSFWELQQEDVDAQYFTNDFETEEEMVAYGNELCRQVEAEGAVLLMNDGALPLTEGAKVSTLSSSSVNLVYGGTGSGNVDASQADSLKVALEKSGLIVNPVLWDFYFSEEGAKYNRSSGSGESMVLAGQATIAEVPVEVYPQSVKDSFAEYEDAIIITISRVGGEGYDLEFTDYNYLALDETEKEMLQFASEQKQKGYIKNIIVLINSSNALQVDFLKENPYHIDACLWIGGVGITGTNAVADILAGKVNPSGRLVDAYCYNNYSAPAMYNFVPTTYVGYEKGEIPANASTYMIYQEGIYVGYKYYETRYEDMVMKTGNAGNYRYCDDVAYPFGYGLSYTSFDYTDMSVNYHADTDQYEVAVTVINTGDMTGKETVQVYAQSPYTSYDKENHVEKAAVQLAGFAKTTALEPGAQERVIIYVDKRDLASYDSYGAGTYILDAGDYYLTVATDAHDAANNILAAKGFGQADGMDAPGKPELTFSWTEEKLDVTTYATSLNGTPITNQFSQADPNLYEGSDVTITYLSRSDWTGTFPTEIIRLTLTEQLREELQEIQYDEDDYEDVKMPTLGADNGLKLYDMIGKEYDDPDWELLLDQLTFDEMVSMIGDSFHWRMPVESVNAPGTRDENGPQGLTAALLGSGANKMNATAFPSEDVMAATFNMDLMYDVGRIIGNNCLNAEVVCLYGPGSNIHRTPYGGRNFEYYSEDGFLSGEIGSAEVKGIQDKGVDVVMKHFALNDCEQERIGQAVWLNEQAAREIYLKAFQKPLEEAGGNGVMTAYTRWGTRWSGGYRNLMTNIMRNEWGNQGMSITDNVLTTYTNGVDGILAGTTTFDAMLWYITSQLKEYEDDAVIVSAMREACHHNLYALANSSGMNGVGENTTVKIIKPKVITIAETLAVLITVLLIVCALLWGEGVCRLRKTEAYRAYKAIKKQSKGT